MPYPVLNAEYNLVSSYATGLDTFHLEGVFVDSTGSFSSGNVQSGDMLAMDLSNYQAGIVGKYLILSADASDPGNLVLEVQWSDEVPDIIDPQFSTGIPALLYRPSPKLGLTADHAYATPFIRASMHNADYWQKLDASAESGGFSVWESGVPYAVGQMVSYRGVVLRVTSAHTSSTTLSQDLPFWDTVDNTAKIKYRVGHGLDMLTPVYVTPTSFFAAQANALETLATHVLLDVGPNHALMVNTGDYYIPGHGLSGVRYVSPLLSGTTTSTEPNPAQYYINPVMVIEDPNWVTVVANQPAYKK
jgi:hypothetical protein